MSVKVDVPNSENQESEAHENIELSSIKDLSTQPEVKKKAIEIKGSDLALVTSECGISRQEAIDLITKADGDIHQALLLYIRQ